MSAPDIPWRDRVAIARHEVAAAAIIAADILDRRDASPPDFDRLALALQRLRVLTELP